MHAVLRGGRMNGNFGRHVRNAERAQVTEGLRTIWQACLQCRAGERANLSACSYHLVGMRAALSGCRRVFLPFGC